MKVKIISLAVLVFCLWQHTSTAQVKIELVAHRGANRLAPENTLAAANAAFDMGVDFLEVDVRRSKNGVYFAFHDETLDRTTNGIGNFREQDSKFLRSLDAGSWFRHSFKSEPIPTIEELVMKFRGTSMKFYFDFKDGDIAEFIALIDSWGLSPEQCFFYFGDKERLSDFITLGSDFPLKVNLTPKENLDSIYEKYHPQIIELGPDTISEEIIDRAHEKNLLVMGWVEGDQRSAYHKMLTYNIDLMNLDNPGIFLGLLKDKKTLPAPYLIAHRGGVVEGLFEEFDPEGLNEAEFRGYKMLEVDVRESKDGVLFVHHDSDFLRIYGDKRKTTEVPWDEIKQFKSIKAGFSPLTFDAYTKLCKGRFDFMIDVKSVNRTPEYYDKVRKVLEKHEMMNNLIFLDQEARKYFWGEARFGVRVRELPDIYAKYLKGEDVASNYYLFDHGMELTALSIKLAQRMHMEVVPSVNIGHYKLEYHMTGAERDIKYCRSLGVTSFQIDSDYDSFFEEGLEL